MGKFCLLINVNAAIPIVVFLMGFVISEIILNYLPGGNTMSSQVEQLVAAEVATEQRISAMVKLLHAQIDALRAEIAQCNQKLVEMSAQLLASQTDAESLQSVIDRLNRIAPETGDELPAPAAPDQPNS